MLCAPSVLSDVLGAQEEELQRKRKMQEEAAAAAAAIAAAEKEREAEEYRVRPSCQDTSIDSALL